MSVYNFIKRQILGFQTTENEVFQRYNNLKFNDLSVTGNISLRTISALNPAGIVPGPTHKLNNPNVTGNTAYGLILQPLTDENLKSL